MFKALGRKKYLALAIPFFMAVQAQSFQFEMGQVEASVDSQLSLGSSWRLEDGDTKIVNAASQSTDDDGNRNFKKGDAFSQIFKGSHDLQFSYQNLGAFVRGKYWYDEALANKKVNHGHAPTSQVNTATTSTTALQSGVTYNGNQTLDDSHFDDLSKAQGATILDAFVYGEFELGEMPLDLRLGKQVVSWGESTFIIGGINGINPADLSAYRRPGAELKEALLPVGMAYANLGITDNLSVETFYQYEFQNTVTDACGTFFSTSDVAPQGCNSLTVEGGLLSVERDDSLASNTSDDNQFGIALRYFADSIDTEFGFYAMTTHNRAPIFNVQSANGQADLNGIVQADALAAALSGGAFTDVTQAVTYLVGQESAAIEEGVALGIMGTEALDAAGNPAYPSNPGLPWASLGVNQQNLADGTSVGGAGLTAVYEGLVTSTTNDIISNEVSSQYATAVAAGRVMASRYFMSYPEDNKMLGVSFSSNIAGIAVSGEVSHKIDSPVQINGVLLTSVALANGVAGTGANQAEVDAYSAVFNDLAAGDKVAGYREFDITQAQATVINTFSNVAGASMVVLVGEVGGQFVHDFDETIKYGRASFFGAPTFESGDGGYATESSWGYRSRMSATYNNVFAGVNMTPTISWSEDVKGNAAGPGGPFLEGNQSLGLSVKANYMERYSAAVSYTQYEGGEYSVTGDRDFASVSVDVQF